MRLFKVGAALLASVLTGLLAALYYLQYFKWRACFNELGRCYDPDTQVVYLEQSGAIWLALAVITGVIAALLWRSATKTR